MAGDLIQPLKLKAMESSEHKVDQDNRMLGFTVDAGDKRVRVQPVEEAGAMFYRVSDNDRFLFILQQDENEQWQADNEEQDPVGTPEPIDQDFATTVGLAIEEHFE